jgi:hypothetical protein
MAQINARSAGLVPAWKFEDAAFSDFQDAVQASTWVYGYSTHDSSGNHTYLVEGTAVVSLGAGDSGAIVDITSTDAHFPAQSLILNDGDYLMFFSGGRINASVVLGSDFDSFYLVADSDN